MWFLNNILFHSMHKILFIANTSWYIYNFRRSLIKALINNGYQVACAAPVDSYTEKLISLGAEYINIEYNNSSKNPVKDLLFLYRLIKLMRQLKPSAVLSFTIKANIYGGIAARLQKTPIVANVSGLGSPFVEDSILSKLALLLYKVGLNRADKIFFQNSDDYELFAKSNIITNQESGVLPGSGVDLERFASSKIRNNNETIIFLLAARLLKEKGIVEGVEAMRELKKQNKNVKLQLLGQLWHKNPTSVKQHELNGWIKEGLVTYLGFVNDVRPYIENANVVLLPSFYREGVPRILLEAASMSKPIITSDVPGCRETVDNGRTGFLCKARDAHDLMEKMDMMIELTGEERDIMGKRGREKMKKEFDEKIVINKYLESINKIVFL